MDPQYWQQRWQRNEIGFHRSEVNPLLIRHWPALQLSPGARVLVPLCGKSRDLWWLQQQGFAVVGVELSRIAVAQFFAEAGLTPTVSELGALSLWRAAGIELYCGDLFQLDASRLGAVDGWYDRAALVALPATLRVAYARHLHHLVAQAPGLLITLEYDQVRVEGPPFAVAPSEIETLHGAHFSLRELACQRSDDLSPKFRQAGLSHLTERITLAQPHPPAVG